MRRIQLPKAGPSSAPLRSTPAKGRARHVPHSLERISSATEAMAMNASPTSGMACAAALAVRTGTAAHCAANSLPPSVLLLPTPNGRRPARPATTGRTAMPVRKRRQRRKPTLSYLWTPIQYPHRLAPGTLPQGQDVDSPSESPDSHAPHTCQDEHSVDVALPKDGAGEDFVPNHGRTRTPEFPAYGSPRRLARSANSPIRRPSLSRVSGPYPLNYKGGGLLPS